MTASYCALCCIYDHGEKVMHIDGLVHVWSNSIADALELLQPCTKPLIFCYKIPQMHHKTGDLLGMKLRYLYWCIAVNAAFSHTYQSI